jgi:hypothetical protein
MFSSCLGRPHAHHQELNNSSNSLRFYRWNCGGSSAIGRGRARKRTTALLAPCSKVNPEDAAAVVEILMMDVRMSETCWAAHKRQVINIRNYCIYLVDLFELYDDVWTCKIYIFTVLLNEWRFRSVHESTCSAKLSLPMMDVQF